jgi:hypothetical protein
MALGAPHARPPVMNLGRHLLPASPSFSATDLTNAWSRPTRNLWHRLPNARLAIRM